MSKAQPIGYLKLWRSIKDWQWYDDVPVRTLFLHLLVEANWEAKRWKDMDIEPGSFVTSTVSLAKDMDTSRASIHRSLRKLESTGEVNIKTNNHWTAITVVNWAKWQGKEETSERPMNVRRTSTERPAGTTKEVKKERSKEENARRLAAPPRMSFEEFRKACLETHKAVNILSSAEAKAFFDYWTEGHKDGKGRWQMEKAFDIALRMANWKKRIQTHGKGVPATMTKAEAHAKLEEYRAANGIAPGGVVETHKIPAEIYAALK